MTDVTTALDRLESWLDQDSREDIATVRQCLQEQDEELERLRGERFKQIGRSNSAILEAEARAQDLASRVREQDEHIQRLTEERDRWKGCVENLRSQMEALRAKGDWPVSKVVARAEAAEAENRRLREGLREIVKEYDLWSEDASDGEFRLWDLDRLCANIVKARALLAGSEAEPDKGGAK